MGGSSFPALQPDLEILPFQLKLGNRVLLHQVNDGLDIFEVHAKGSLKFFRAACIQP